MLGVRLCPSLSPPSCVVTVLAESQVAGDPPGHTPAHTGGGCPEGPAVGHRAGCLQPQGPEPLAVEGAQPVGRDPHGGAGGAEAEGQSYYGRSRACL